MSRISFKNVIRRNDPEYKKRDWVSYRFQEREFKQRKHGSSVYDTVVRYVSDDYYESGYDQL